MNYYDIYYQPGNEPVFCYRTGLAVYEEKLVNGALVSCGYNASGYPLNVLSGYPSRLDHTDFHEPFAFNIEIDGQSIDYCLKFVDFTTNKNDNNIEGILTLDSEIKPVRLKIHTILDGSQMFSRFIEIENLSDNTLNLSRLSLLSGGIEEMNNERFNYTGELDKIYSLGYFDNCTWGNEGDFAWHDLPACAVSIDSRFNRDRFRHPLIFIRNNVTGVMYFSQIGWSAGCRFTVDFNAFTTRNENYLSFKAEITSHKPMTVILPHENFETPQVHMGVVFGGLDDAVNEMHDHIRKSVLTMKETDPTPCHVFSGMGAEHDMSVETTKSFIRQFAQMGAEAFTVDAGWVCPVTQGNINWGGYNGLNVPDPDRYPNGIAEIVDYCHSQGLKFALWMDIETFGELTDLREKHPDWMTGDIYGNSSGGALDLTLPHVAQWAEDELARVIEEYKIDILRVDHNFSFNDYFAVRDLGTDIKECLSIRRFKAVYRMYENLKKRFPDVIFENCAGGGGRTDLGIMKYFNHTWVSDCQRAPRSVVITNGMTLALPPERVDRLSSGMGCHESGSLDFQMRNTMLTHMTLNTIAPAEAQLNPIQMEFVKHCTDIHKNFIRKFLPVSKIYHHTPETKEMYKKGYCAIEVSSPDKQQGAIGVFTMANTSKSDYIIAPKGIDEGVTYEVMLDNSGSKFIINGYELKAKGIPVSISTSLSSELILYKAL